MTTKFERAILRESTLRPRIVISPHGMPRHPDAHERCCNHLLHCNGDLQRVIEGKPGSLDRFIHHLTRIPGLCEGAPPLVLMTRTNPLGLAILQTRRALEEAIPELALAAWLIFLDEREDPFFMDAAAHIGSMVVGASAAVLWLAPHHQRFLVLPARDVDPEDLRGRLAQLGAGAPEPAPPPASTSRISLAVADDEVEAREAAGATD